MVFFFFCCIIIIGQTRRRRQPNSGQRSFTHFIIFLQFSHYDNLFNVKFNSGTRFPSTTTSWTLRRW